MSDLGRFEQELKALVQKYNRRVVVASVFAGEDGPTVVTCFDIDLTCEKHGMVLGALIQECRAQIRDTEKTIRECYSAKDAEAFISGVSAGIEMFQSGEGGDGGYLISKMSLGGDF